MPLFHPRVIKKITAQALEIPPAHAAILSEWARFTDVGGAIHRQKETALTGLFREKIVTSILGYQPFNSDFYDVATEFPLAGNRVDLALGVFDPNDETQSKCLAPFELKGAKTKLDVIMAGRNKTPVQQAWDYAMDAKGAKWVLVSNYLEIRLYAVGYGRQDYEGFNLAKLTDPAEYTRFYKLLCKENFLGGQTKTWLDESALQDKSITARLYQDYKELRLHLIQAIAKNNPALDKSAAITYAQILLDRALFIAFAEDKELLPDNTLRKAYEHKDPYAPRSVWETFKALFTAINQGNAHLKIPKYNGGLFADNVAINALSLPDTVFEGFKKLGEYDFQSDVSVNILGHIFEQSISDLEALHEEAPLETAPKKDGKRKKEGVVYTPAFITAFIVEQTLGGYLEQKKQELQDANPKWFVKKGERKGEFQDEKSELAYWRAWQDSLKEIKIVDPACGSGAFLVAAFDYLYAEYRQTNDRIAELRGGTTDVFDPDREILTHNLYGVDINSESIEITKLSLWLKTAKRGKELNSLDENFRWGDSLIEDSHFSDRSFTWKNAFKNIFKNGGFDVVLGNPPYVRMELIKPLKPYLEKRYEVTADRIDLYAYFFELGLRVLKPGGRMGYICSSTFFKTGSGQNLRAHILKNAALEAIVDFGDLQVFEGVTTYPAILVMRKGAPAKKHELTFIKLQSLPDNLGQKVRADGKLLAQSALNDDSWQLENVNLQALRDKIIKGRKSLKEVYGSPLYGIKTGLNEAFIIDNTTCKKLIQQDKKSAELIKPHLTGEELKSWHIGSRERWIIYIPKNKININDYPAIKEYLLPLKEKLEKRAAKQEWFELQQAQLAYQPVFEGAKIVYPDITNIRKFSLIKTPRYLSDLTFFIPANDDFLLPLLMSNISWFYLHGICPKIRGGFLRLKGQYVETLPIPAATPAQKKKIGDIAEACQKAAEERYALQEKVRCRLSDLTSHSWNGKLGNKLNNWWAMDFKAFQAEVKKVFKRDIPIMERDDWQKYLSVHGSQIAALTEKIENLERNLNKEVYALFNLTPEEIRLVEENV